MIATLDAKRLLSQALEEDSAFNDVTSLATIPSNATGIGKVLAKQNGVFSGYEICSAISTLVPQISIKECLHDGQPFQIGDTVVCLEGNVRDLLRVERTVLNFLMHLCGVATLTAQFVRAVENTGIRIVATRKTIPGLRHWQLKAVVDGGGWIHRRNLSDGILIKDNHLLFTDAAKAVASARHKAAPLHKVEVEVQSLDMLASVLEAKPDIVMLDNFSPEHVEHAVRIIADRALVEVSGGITLQNIKQYVIRGVSFISIGGLTHSAPACDLSMDLCHVS